MTNMSIRHRLADLIDEVAAERTLPATALDEAESWEPGVWSDIDAREAHHALVHYREDEDIRSRDEGYRRDQQQWLSGFSKRLRDIRVAIVFTGDVGESLARLASLGHVWVAQSPLNERAVQAFWRIPDQPFSVTLFNEADSKAPALERLRIVGMVEEHRWDYSSTHEYPILEVVGLPLDASAADYLRTFGFSRFEERPNGFEAHRPARPHELA